MNPKIKKTNNIKLAELVPPSYSPSHFHNTSQKKKIQKKGGRRLLHYKKKDIIQQVLLQQKNKIK